MKKCIQCQGEIKGRTDKRFCNDKCRSTFNNNLKRETKKKVIKVNKVLRKNRNILESFVSTKVSKYNLINEGFNFNYLTSINNNYYYCYDYGYKHIGDDVYFIVKEN